MFDNVEITVADLSGATLGLARNDSIVIDTDAPGHGWFVDTTPLDAAEFSPGSQLSSLASQLRIDELTAVMHELGHAAGLHNLGDTDHKDDLMLGLLEAGVRKTSFAASPADETFAGI